MKEKPIRALQSLPRCIPFATSDLKSLGISPALASHYAGTGWLERLGRGVFKFPHDKLSRDGCLKFLEQQIPGFHVGGKTALAWRGIRHHLPSREALTLWGENSVTLPLWFTNEFNALYTGRHIFSDRLPKKFGLQPLPEAPDGALVSVPERALLEMLSEVGIRQGIEEARDVMEGVRTVRPEVLQRLLKNCQRIKVARLCVHWADELNLDWAPVARRAVKTGSSRWTSKLKDGSTLVLKA
jgi:hypothetical protein